jgi:hypothetical protein
VSNVNKAAPGALWKDVVTVAYELTNYRLRRGPNLDWAGLQSDDTLLVWLHDPGYTWLFARIGRKAMPQPEGVLRLKQVADGAYTVVWRDTWTGKILGYDTAEARDGSLELRTPVITKSAIAKLNRISK